MAKTLKEKIIKKLLDSLDIQKDELEEAIIIQKRTGTSLENILLRKGVIKEKDLFVLLVRELNIPFINLSKFKIDQSLKEVIPERVARQYGIIPLSALEGGLTIALSDPLDVFIADDLKNVTGKEIDVVMSTEEEIAKAIDQYYGPEALKVEDISKEIPVEELEIVKREGSEEGIDTILGESKKPPIIRMVNLIIKEAIVMKASDIHIEPTMDAVRVRFRIDGILHDILEIPKKNQSAVIVRIKIMSRSDITVNQIPQDGRFKLKIADGEIDFRVSLLPTAYGQKVVMRILDKATLSVGPKGLGMTDKAVGLLKEAIKKPFGMILVTGPTGSGKSTTLYSLIQELNTIDRNIITIEDPVEYLIDGLTQIQVHAEIGLTFAQGLRSVLRQSPDVVMIGEIRDNETADIAIKASLTGQLVLSTLHTNDSAGALTRLVDMNVEPFLVASSLILVTAQRLCRKICAHCKEPVKISKAVFDRVDYKFKGDAVFYKGKGCEHCRLTGYSGRMGITEILEVDDHIRSMLLNGKSSDEIKQYAYTKKGMISLWEDAIERCLQGVTTLEEVLRVAASQ